MEGKAADDGDIKPFFHLLVFDDTQSSIRKSRDQNRAAVAGRLAFERQFRIALN